MTLRDDLITSDDANGSNSINKTCGYTVLYQIRYNERKLYSVKTEFCVNIFCYLYFCSVHFMSVLDVHLLYLMMQS